MTKRSKNKKRWSKGLQTRWKKIWCRNKFRTFFYCTKATKLSSLRKFLLLQYDWLERARDWSFTREYASGRANIIAFFPCVSVVHCPLVIKFLCCLDRLKKLSSWLVGQHRANQPWQSVTSSRQGMCASTRTHWRPRTSVSRWLNRRLRKARASSSTTQTGRVQCERSTSSWPRRRRYQLGASTWTCRGKWLLILTTTVRTCRSAQSDACRTSVSARLRKASRPQPRQRALPRCRLFSSCRSSTNPPTKSCSSNGTHKSTELNILTQPITAHPFHRLPIFIQKFYYHNVSKTNSFPLWTQSKLLNDNENISQSSAHVVLFLLLWITLTFCVTI